MKAINGTLRWFCNTSGEGMVSGEDGGSYYLHWSAVMGKFPPKYQKKSWVELESGWKVRFTLYGHQVDKLQIVAKTKPRKIPSAYVNREEMKAKLTATYAMFDELFPQTTMNWDRYHWLSNQPKLTAKQETELKDLELERDRHNKELTKWNLEKSAVVVSIYREHSRYPLTKGI